MKRHGNLFDRICSIENLKEASVCSSRGKKHYAEVIQFNKDVDSNCNAIRSMLLDRSFTTSDYVIKTKRDGDKIRDIYVLPFFPDRVVQHAIVQVLEPIFMKRFIRNTFQSIKGRGTIDCKRRVERLTKATGSSDLYCLQLDIRKFYPSINNEVLKAQLRQFIKCQPTLWLLDDIIDSTEGLPIGNYLSQHLGNLYLTGLDRFAKEQLGCKNYFRYCDDIVVLHTSKDFLHNVRAELDVYAQQLHLEVKDNWQVFPLSKRGLDFVGYVFCPGYTKLRKRIKVNVKRKALRRESTLSYYGWIKHCSGKRLWAAHGVSKLGGYNGHVHKKSTCTKRS